MLTVSRTAQSGLRAGLIAALGINAGCALHALAAAFGLAALLAWSAAAFSALKWAGAAYCCGWPSACCAAPGAARCRRQPHGPSGAAVAPVASAAADFRRGLLTNLLNPKVALFMLAFLPQFIPAQATHKTLAFLVLGLLFIVQSLLFLRRGGGADGAAVAPAAAGDAAPGGCRRRAGCCSSRWPSRLAGTRPA